MAFHFKKSIVCLNILKFEEISVRDMCLQSRIMSADLQPNYASIKLCFLFCQITSSCKISLYNLYGFAAIFHMLRAGLGLWEPLLLDVGHRKWSYTYKWLVRKGHAIYLGYKLFTDSLNSSWLPMTIYYNFYNFCYI